MRSTGKGRSSAKTSSTFAQSFGAKSSGLGGRGKGAPQDGRGLPRAAPEGERPSLYDEVTAKIISELEAGRAPWVRPWGKVSGVAPSLPRNVTTGRAYSGVNVLILWGALIERRHADQSWLTYPQAKAAGGQVRRGEEGVKLVYANRFTPKAEAERAALAGEEAGSVPFLKPFTVFNIDQCDGLDHLVRAPVQPLPERELIPHVEALIQATGADFRIGGNEAFYSPTFDYVRVPPQPAFRDPINYYRTALHELSHWTGHRSRLDRDQTGAFGSKLYAFEELVAELSAAFACAALGVAPTVRHADYIGSWLSVLREDNRAIFRAASKASRSADFLTAFDPRHPADNEAAPQQGAETADPDGPAAGTVDLDDGAAETADPSSRRVPIGEVAA